MSREIDSLDVKSSKKKSKFSFSSISLTHLIVASTCKCCKTAVTDNSLLLFRLHKEAYSESHPSPCSSRFTTFPSVREMSVSQVSRMHKVSFCPYSTHCYQHNNRRGCYSNKVLSGSIFFEISPHIMLFWKMYNFSGLCLLSRGVKSFQGRKEVIPPNLLSIRALFL